MGINTNFHKSGGSKPVTGPHIFGPSALLSDRATYDPTLLSSTATSCQQSQGNMVMLTGGGHISCPPPPHPQISPASALRLALPALLSLLISTEPMRTWGTQTTGPITSP